MERKLSRSPGANVSWVDRLDQETTPQQNATQAQPVLVKHDSLDVLEDGQLLGSKRDEDGERGRNRTLNLLINSQWISDTRGQPLLNDLSVNCNVNKEIDVLSADTVRHSKP